MTAPDMQRERLLNRRGHEIVQFEHGHVLVRHLRDQRDFRGLTCLRGAKIGGQRLILQALHAPEEIDFP